MSGCPDLCKGHGLAAVAPLVLECKCWAPEGVDVQAPEHSYPEHVPELPSDSELRNSHMAGKQIFSAFPYHSLS